MLIGCPVSCHKLLIASTAKQGSDPQNQKITDAVAIYGLIFSCLIIFFRFRKQTIEKYSGGICNGSFFHSTDSYTSYLLILILGNHKSFLPLPFTF